MLRRKMLRDIKANFAQLVPVGARVAGSTFAGGFVVVDAFDRPGAAAGGDQRIGRHVDETFAGAV